MQTPISRLNTTAELHTVEIRIDYQWEPRVERDDTAAIGGEPGSAGKLCKPPYHNVTNAYR